jgi:D-alanine-D-alanine ligase
MQRIGILRGGVSPEFHFSLKTGANVQRALAEAGFEAVDMLLDKEGVLHIKGIPADLEKAQASVDLIWNALHGTFGEDGQIQRMLDQYNIPYTGAGALTSAMAFNKEQAKEHVRRQQLQLLGLDTPKSLLIIPEGDESVADVTRRIYETMAPPWVLKPLSGGGSVRSYFAFTPLELSQFVDESLSHGEPFIAEQYIYGKEAAVGVINDFRNQSEYVLPAVEIKSPSRGILHHDMRTGEFEYAIPGGTLRPDEREKLGHYAKKLHAAFNAEDYSQSEFIVDKNGKVWFIEFDTHPHLTDKAPFLVALESVGATLQEFVKSIIERKK